MVLIITQEYRIYICCRALINELLQELVNGQKKIAEEQRLIREEQKKLCAENAELRQTLSLSASDISPIASSTPSRSKTTPSTPGTPGAQKTPPNTVRRRVVESTPASSPKKHSKPSAPCRQSLRSVYKALIKNQGSSFSGYDFSTNFQDPCNVAVTDRLVKGVVAENDGKEKCLHSKTEIRCAARRYFKTLKDAKNKENKGKASSHKQKARRQGRKRERRDRYLQGLKLINWTESSKEVMKTALLEHDVVSSDESDEEDGKIVYRVKRIPYLSERVEEMKKLYTKYTQSLAASISSNFRRRTYEGDLSSRQPPKNCPAWILN